MASVRRGSNSECHRVCRFPSGFPRSPASREPPSVKIGQCTVSTIATDKRCRKIFTEAHYPGQILNTISSSCRCQPCWRNGYSCFPCDCACHASPEALASIHVIRKDGGEPTSGRADTANVVSGPRTATLRCALPSLSGAGLSHRPNDTESSNGLENSILAVSINKLPCTAIPLIVDPKNHLTVSAPVGSSVDDSISLD